MHLYEKNVVSKEFITSGCVGYMGNMKFRQSKKVSRVFCLQQCSGVRDCYCYHVCGDWISCCRFLFTGDEAQEMTSSTVVEITLSPKSSKTSVAINFES
jgi:hypothetical protein